MRATLLFLALAALPFAASAETLQCAFQRGDRAPYYFDIKPTEKTTKLRYAEILEAFNGTVTRTTKADDGTVVYNLSYTDVTAAKTKDTEWEFVLRFKGDDSRLFGVGYAVVGGKRFLSTPLGEFQARCRMFDH